MCREGALSTPFIGRSRECRVGSASWHANLAKLK